MLDSAHDATTEHKKFMIHTKGKNMNFFSLPIMMNKNRIKRHHLYT